MADSPSREQLELAIAAQEGLRATLGNAVVDAAIAALRAQLATITEVGGVAQQRKLVTVLFMDIVRSTDLIQGRDPEEAMSILDAVLARLGEAVHGHGGRVIKYMGDGFMAAFGLSNARENEPEMATRAGLAIVRGAEDMAPEMARTHGIANLAVRVGINTGLVAIGGLTEAGDTIIGDAVNLAARLEHAARPGGVLISRGTRQHVRGLFDLEDGGTIDVQGFPDPVRIYHVLGRTAGATRAARDIEGVDTPMVGRQAELTRLQEAFEAAATTRSLRAVTVLGEAGLGKSRLLDELRARLGPIDHVRIEGRAMLETQQLPYGLVRELLERRYGIRSDDGAGTARARLAQGIKADLDGGTDGAAGDDNDDDIFDAVDTEQRACFIGQLVGFDLSDNPHIRTSLESPQQIRNRAVKYLGELIAALSERNPVILVLEDLQWADAGSFDVIERVVEDVAERRVFVIGAARPSLREQRPSWGQSDNHEWIHLGPLSDPEIDELAAAALVNVRDLPDDLRRNLVKQAGGSPYYLEEIIRMLVDDGIIVPGEGAWTIDLPRSATLRIPPTLTGVIQARLDGLPLDDRLALQRASVVGRVFWDAVVEGLASADVHPLDVTSSLDALERREMVHARLPSTFSDAAEYAFHHELLQSVAYEGVLLRTRRSYHSLVADWLIAHRGDRGAELSGLIAGHLEGAGRSTEALDYLAQAAASALAAYAVEAADGFYARALALVPQGDTATRFTLLLGRERTLGMRECPDQQLEVLDELAALATTDDAVANVGIQRVWYHYFAGEFAHAVEAARSAVAAAARAGDPALEALARRALASGLVAGDEPDAALPEAELALSLARKAHNAWIEMKVTNTLGLIAVARSDLSVARRYLDAYLEMARDQGALDDEVSAGTNLGTVHTQLGNYPVARAHFERSCRIAGEVGDRFAEASALVNLAWVASSEGEWATARELALTGLARKRASGHPDAVAEGLVWLGHAELGMGDHAAARAAYGESLDLREELGQIVHAMEARAGLGKAELAGGNLDAAREQAAAITRYLDEGGALDGAWEPMRVHLSCVEILQAAGDPNADRVLERAVRTLRRHTERIQDDDDRRMFLQQVPWHRRILELAQGGAF